MASFVKDTQVKLPRPTRVKNKTPAPLQITAEQLLREARERQEPETLPPKQNITDSAELSDYRLRRRKDFEDRTKHYKVWVSFAKFEAGEQEEDAIERSREVLDRAYMYYKDVTPELKEERAKLLEDWLSLEVSFGMLGDVSIVESKLPKKLKKRKTITGENGSMEYVEYTDYLFPEELKTSNFKILEAAVRWKKQKIDAF